MKAYIYDLVVAIDPVHSWSNHTISEIFIPKYKIAFNNEKFFFQCSEPRNKKYEKIEVNNKFAETLDYCIRIRNEIEEEMKTYFNKGAQNG